MTYNILIFELIILPIILLLDARTKKYFLVWWGINWLHMPAPDW